jgi:hypothetical protein
MKRFLVLAAKTVVLAGMVSASAFAQVQFDRAQPGSSVTGNRATSNYQPYVLPSTVCDINNTNCITAATQRPAYVLPNTVCDASNNNCRTFANTQDYVLPSTVCDINNTNCITAATQRPAYVAPADTCTASNNFCRTVANTPVIPTLPPDICTASNGYCNQAAPPPPPVASGTQCGWIAAYQGDLSGRIPCQGNTLGMGNIAVCPYGTTLVPRFASGADTCQSPVQVDPSCIPSQGVDGTSCNLVPPVPPSYYTYGPVTKDFMVSDWNCPYSYTFTRIISSGGSNGSDNFSSCVKS